jgi:hypothetical protein
MRNIATAAITLAVAGAMAIPLATPAAAQSFSFQYGQQDRFVSDRCERNPRLRGCDDWRNNRQSWGKSDYQRWYRWNQPSIGSVGAGLFGFFVGAAIANGIGNSNSSNWNGNGSWSSHVARCEARFRSYNANTDTYLGYDGNYHRCTL